MKLVITIENVMREVTEPGDTIRKYAPTGKQTAWILGIRVPVRFALWIYRRTAA